MKQLLTALILIGAINLCYSQNECENGFSGPDELYRGCYNPEGMNYGNHTPCLTKGRAVGVCPFKRTCRPFEPERQAMKRK
jgi:hypothetical protein